MTRILRAAPLAAFGIVAMLAITTTGAGAIQRSGDTEDKYSPSGVMVTGTSQHTVFTAGGITVTCTHSVAAGKTASTGLGAFAISHPVFDDGSGHPCTDNLGGSDTTSIAGTWKIGFKDAANDEAQSEPNAGDKLFVVVPKGGAVVHNSFGCTITVAPNSPFTVTGTYNDRGTFTVNISNLPIRISGGAACPSASTSTFSGTYNFSPVVTDHS